jgi:hypothetical protein
MEAARIHDEEATTIITKSSVTGQTSPSAPGTEFHAVGENVVEMTSHGGKLHPVDGSKKTP